MMRPFGNARPDGTRTTLRVVFCLGVGISLLLLVIASSIFLQYHPLDVFYQESRRDVPALIYHGVSRNPVSEYEVPFGVFADQMAYLKQQGYRTLSGAEVAEYLVSGAEIPERSIFLSFHDQSEGWSELVAPLLQKYEFKATFFIIVDRTPEQNQERRTSWESFRQMLALRDAHGTRLFEVGGHTFRHDSLSQEAHEDEDTYRKRLRHELTGNADVIEAALSHRPIAFALPRGDGFGDRFERQSIRTAAEEAGYRLVQTSRYFDADEFWIGGMSIHGTPSSMLEFEFSLRYASHDTCLADFGIWLSAVVERVFWRTRDLIDPQRPIRRGMPSL